MSRLRVAYQGEPGAYSEQAVFELFRHHPTIEPAPHVTFSAVFDAVTSDTCHLALVPIENSLGGSIHDNYDLLVSHDVAIIAELEFQVHHCLMALPSQSLASITTVISHPQALAQCEDYIKNRGLTAEKQYDTAGSAKMIAEKKMTGYAAIASALAAQYYGLTVLASNVEDDDQNFTRFLLIARTQSLPLSLSSLPSIIGPSGASGDSKTSIVFALVDAPGVLFKALSVFALRDIHLSKIESRPGKRLKQLVSDSNGDSGGSGGVGGSGAFKYLFYLDLLAHSEDARVINALNHLKEIAPFLRVLGSYRAATHRRNTDADIDTTTVGAKSKLRIGIVGFGNFGQFLGMAFVRHGHEVHAASRTDYSDVARQMRITYHSNYQSLLSTQPDIIVLSVSILSFEDTVNNFPWSMIGNRECLIVDVLSVKIHPKNILLSSLPAHFDILCTHPMFGPDSGKHSWKGLSMMYERVRVRQSLRSDLFLSLFDQEGCRMLELSCELHDAYAAGSQFITHTTGRLLANLGCEETPINTKGYSMLLQVIANTTRDSFDLYRGLYQFNPHSHAQLEAMEKSFQSLKHRLTHSDSDGVSSKSQQQAATFNPRVLSMNESKTAQVTDLAKKLQSEGKQIISLSVGEPLDVQTPRPILDAAIKALNDGETRYTPIAGLLTLRKAIVEKLARENGLTYTADQIIVSNGAKQSILQTVMALSTPDCEIVIPAPYWVSYPDMCTLCGARPIIVDTDADSGFLLTATQLKSVMNERTRAVIFCSPSNPTGGVYDRQSLLAIAAVVAQYPQCYVISDEIYEHLLFDDSQHVSFASLPNMHDRTITVNGFSKCFAMTGFRLGYIAAPLMIASLCNKIQGQLTSCASSISQHAGIAALEMDLAPFKRQLNTMLTNKRNLVYQLLNSIPAVKFHLPLGAFYAMPDVSAYYGRRSPHDGTMISDSDTLCLTLLQHFHVALVPGSAFGAPKTVRISYANDEREVVAGVQALVDCLRELVE